LNPFSVDADAATIDDVLPCCTSWRCVPFLIFFLHRKATITVSSTMSISSTSTFLLTTGTALLFHAAYSCLHYRLLLRDLEDSGVLIMETDPLHHHHHGTDHDAAAAGGSSFSPSLPPLDVWIEVALAFFMILFSEFCRSGSSLQPVVVTTNSTTKGTRGERKQPGERAAPLYRTRDFDIYAGRGRAF
jgi:Membrane magnesium transporter